MSAPIFVKKMLPKQSNFSKIGTTFAIIFIAFQTYKSTAIAQQSHEKSTNRIEVNVSEELTKIKQEKLSIDANLKKQQAACYKNFAVSSCLKDTKIEAQTALNDVKRREAAINDQQRTAKIESQQSKKEKAAVKNTESSSGGDATSDAKDKIKTIKTAKPGKVIKSDEDILTEKNAAEKSRTDAAKKRLADVNDKQIASQKKAQSRANKNSESAANSAKYNQKLRQAQAHKDELEKANLAKKKPKSAPLPIPNLMPNRISPKTTITTTP
jgi:colicin import membrane protein